MDEVTSLALSAGRGDQGALGEFIRRTQADVWRFCAHLAGARDADDLTQETYARALRSLPSFRGDAPARAWLLTIARRACADHVRSAQRRRRLTGQVESQARVLGAGGLSDGAEARGLVDAIERLPEDFRVAFTLTQMLGLSYAETASVCGCPVGTVRSRVARAREAVVAALDATAGMGRNDAADH